MIIREDPTGESRTSRTVSITRTVETLEQAFAFVIAQIDAERFHAPNIEIHPWFHYSPGDDPDVPPRIHFSVSVQGEQVRPE